MQIFTCKFPLKHSKRLAKTNIGDEEPEILGTGFGYLHWNRSMFNKPVGYW